MSRAHIFLLSCALLVGAVALATLYTQPTGSGAAAVAPKSKPAPVRTKRPGQPAPYDGDLPSLAAVNVRDAILDVVIRDLTQPWSMEFVDPQTLLIAEQPGRLLLLSLDTRDLTEISGLPDIPTGPPQVGLLDIALHPAFADNARLYFSHSVQNPDNGHYTTALSTGILRGQQLTDVERLVTALPYARSGSNFGGAIAFDDAGFLYFATGDKSVRDRSQNPRFLNGKVLRLNDDGSIPADNPFIGEKGIRLEIYAMGVRNPQGLFFDTTRGQLFEAEHGPMGGDEVNIIEAGRNYGWPIITYGANYNTQTIGEGTAAPGLEQPLYYYLPSTAVSPLTVYYGPMFPEWEGDLLVGALKGSHISKLDLVDGAILSEQKILREVKGRVRDIKVAADGSIYVLVQNGGRLFRLHRQPAEATASAVKPDSDAAIYRQVCASCHDAGLEAIPQRSDRAHWQQRLKTVGRAVLYANTRTGINGMPAKGLCEECSEEQLKAAVDYLLDGEG